MTPEEIAAQEALLNKVKAEAQGVVAEATKNMASSADVQKMNDAVKALTDQLNGLKGEELQKAISDLEVDFKAFSEQKATDKTIAAMVNEFIEEKSADIKNVYKSGHGNVELEIKAVGTITTANATLPVAAPALQGVQVAPPDPVNLRAMQIVNLTNNINTNQASFAYSESIPKDGVAAYTAEGVAKTQIDLTITTRYAAPVKAAAWMQLTEEAVTDIPQMQSIATDYLFRRHNLVKSKGILTGDGIAPNPKGATSYGRAFVGGSMTGTLASGTANIMDVINAAITDIYTTHNFLDEVPYMANLVLMNPVTFFIEFVSAKDAHGRPLYPTATLFNQVTIGGVTVIPEETIPAGSILVCDMSKYNTTNYVPYSVRIGWINDDFIKNQFVILGESRFHAFVKELDEQAFIYDTIANIVAAIELP
jgi:hypothetical protein